MSSVLLSVFPDDPEWQPSARAADAALAMLRGLLPGGPDDGADAAPTGCRALWHDEITPVDQGEGMVRAGCPGCGEEIPLGWWYDRVEELSGRGLESGSDMGAAPCCDVVVCMEDLKYEQIMGFARFVIEIWHPERERLTAEELDAVGDALGTDVRQATALWTIS